MQRRNVGVRPNVHMIYTTTLQAKTESYRYSPPKCPLIAHMIHRLVHLIAHLIAHMIAHMIHGRTPFHFESCGQSSGQNWHLYQ